MNLSHLQNPLSNRNFLPNKGQGNGWQAAIAGMMRVSKSSSHLP